MYAIRWARLAANIDRSTGRANRSRYREKNVKVRGLAASFFGNQNQLSTMQAVKREPITRNGKRQLPKSAINATAGTPITADKVVNEITVPTARASRAGGTTSTTAAMPLGGIIPPPSPVTTLVTIKVSRLGANAEAKTPTASSDSPASATGRRPSESDKGPTETTDMAQAAKVAVPTCPATATDRSNSAAISTNNGANINDELWVKKKARATAAKNRF